jgi:DNA-binding CsgD family transcriptional regulator
MARGKTVLAHESTLLPVLSRCSTVDDTASMHRTDAEFVVRLRARRLVTAGLVMAATTAAGSSARAAMDSPHDLLGRQLLAGALVLATALCALAFRVRVVSALERDGRWMIAWSALVVVAFAIDGPGDELLLPAALGPIGVAALVGRVRDALACALLIDAGYLIELAYTGQSFGAGTPSLVAANCAFVLLTAGVIALPIRLAFGLSENVTTIVERWRLEPSSAPRVVRAARYPALAAGPLLDEQEQRVVTMIGRGMYYAAIARAEQQALGRPCSERTVRKIVARAKKKTGARTRAELVAFAETELSAVPRAET